MEDAGNVYVGGAVIALRQFDVHGRLKEYDPSMKR